MASTLDTIRFPKAPLFAAGMVLAGAVLAVASARFEQAPMSPGLVPLAESAFVTSRLLRFEDMDNGGVGVIDAKSGMVVAIADPGTNGFLRGTLRGLMRVRKRDALPVEAPFRLGLLGSGELLLEDEAEGSVIALSAFGSTNAAVFAAFLPKKEGNS